MHLILTGRQAPPEVIEIADTVTEMRKLKHAFDSGIVAEQGIEFLGCGKICCSQMRRSNVCLLARIFHPAAQKCD